MFARVTLFFLAFLMLLFPICGQGQAKAEKPPSMESETSTEIPEPQGPVVIEEVTHELELARILDFLVPWTAGALALLLFCYLAYVYVNRVKLQKKVGKLIAEEIYNRWSTDHSWKDLYWTIVRIRYRWWPVVVIDVSMNRERYPDEDFTPFRKEFLDEAADVINNSLRFQGEIAYQVIVSFTAVRLEVCLRGERVWQESPADIVLYSPEP